MRLLKLLLVVLAFAAGPAVAGPFEDGSVAYNKGDYATALRLWRPLADQGEAQAQYELGFMYTNGWGVPQDYAAAVAWWRKAADQGYATAQYTLGVMYYTGKVVPQDYVQALKWLNVAASRSSVLAKETRETIAAKMTPAIAAKMTPAQLAEAQKLAREWKPTLPPTSPTLPTGSAPPPQHSAIATPTGPISINLRGQWDVTMAHNPAYIANVLIDAQGRATADSPHDSGKPANFFGYVAQADGMKMQMIFTDRSIVTRMNCSIMSSDLLHCVTDFPGGTKSPPFILTRVGPGPQYLTRPASK